MNDSGHGIYCEHLDTQVTGINPVERRGAAEWLRLSDPLTKMPHNHGVITSARYKILQVQELSGHI
ncbi:MAG: hypothetical protein ACI8R9_002879 [Paraglaciecola sp.]|jgi:hypothetical protein